MNTSLIAVQMPSDSAGNAPGVSANLSGKQQDSAFPGGFGPVLDQANTALATDADGSAPLAEDMQDLASQLQDLPQGGKLLPLLQQVLDSAAANGTDRQQVIDSIAARLEQLRAGGETDPVAALTATLNQMLAPPPGQALTAENVNRVINAQGRSGKASGTAGEPGPALRPAPQPVPAAAANDRLLPGDTPADSKNSLFDRSLMDIQQQNPEPRQSELSALVAAFKRQLDNPVRSADSLPRPEVLSATGSAAASSPPTAVAPPGQTTLTLATPLNQAGWDQALGERVQWLAGQNLQAARITLNPANLGPMEVRIQIQNDQASVQFTSAHGVVRDALEAALPRLRDMFEASGVQLVDVDVTGQSFAGQQHGTDGEGIAGRAGADGAQRLTAAEEPALDLLSETPLAGFPAPGRLDLFA